MLRNLALVCLLNASAVSCGVANADSGGGAPDAEKTALRKRIELLERQQESDVETLAAARRLLALIKVTDAGDIVITGADLYLQNGSGATMPGDPLKAKGNLILGYDETPTDGRECPKQSAHSLIVGPYICRDNVSGAFAQGTGHVLKGDWSGAYGGAGNHANGWSSTVIGGMGNEADASASTISGGGYNHVERTADGATLSGAYHRSIENSYGHVTGTSSGAYPPAREDPAAPMR